MSAPCPRLGFSVTIKGPAADAEREALRAELADLLARYDLSATPGDRRETAVMVVREGSQATEADRRVVRAWAANWAGRASIEVGDIVDLSGDS